MRLIDADAVHKFVENKVAEGKGDWKNGVPYEWAWALAAVDAQPTVEAEPVRHGRWEWYEEWTDAPSHVPSKLVGCDWLCSECGVKLAEYIAQEEPTESRFGVLARGHIAREVWLNRYLNRPSYEPKLSYCPHCGAKTDGGDDHDGSA